MSIFEFTDYKIFIKQTLRNRGTFGRGSMARLAEYISVHPTFISQVLSGSKDFLEEQALPISEFLGLNESEQEYFLILVQIERAGSKKLKDYFRKRRDHIRTSLQKIENRVQNYRTLTDAEKSRFYSNWQYSAVHLMSTLEGEVSFHQVCQRLKISPQKCRKIIDFLTQINLVVESNGTLSPGFQNTHLENDSDFVSQHHRNWRLKAIEKIESLTSEELMYSVNVSLSKEDFAKMKELLSATIIQFIKTVQTSPAEDIALLNVDFFWI